MSVVSKAGEKIQRQFRLGVNTPFVYYPAVEGGHPPTVFPEKPLHFEHTDYFGLLYFSRKDQDVYGKKSRCRDLVKEEFENWDLTMHKEEEVEVATLLGVEVDGSSPSTKPVEERRWLVF